jgi:TfoX/Sxy family transcriptional regulator of competence genes
MAYSEELEKRIKTLVFGWGNTEAKKMFGGVCHLLNGNMFCGVHKDSLILRLGEELSKSAMEMPAVKPFDMTGRPMKGWIMVESGGIKTDDKLNAWLEKARSFASTLPPKKK